MNTLQGFKEQYILSFSESQVTTVRFFTPKLYNVVLAIFYT